MACPTKPVHRSHRMCTLRHTSLVHLVVRRVHNGEHTLATRRQRDLLLHHLQQVATGVAIAWPNCKTLRCRRNHSIPMTSAIACHSLHSSSNSRLSSHQWLLVSPARLARTPCVHTRSHNVRHHQRIVACRLHPRTSIQLRISLRLLTSRHRIHPTVRIKVLHRSRQCRLLRRSAQLQAFLRHRTPCKRLQAKARCRHTLASPARAQRSGR